MSTVNIINDSILGLMILSEGNVIEPIGMTAVQVQRLIATPATEKVKTYYGGLTKLTVKGK